jgi:hypothetical protein
VAPRNEWLVAFKFEFVPVCTHVLVHPASRKYAIVIRQYGATFPRSYIFMLVKTERSRVTNSADSTASIDRADRLARVFDDPEIELLRDFCNSVHIAHEIQHVNGYDRLGVRRDLSLNILRINCQALIDVDKHGDRANGQWGDGRRNPSVGRHQHFVAWPNASSYERSDQRIRAAVYDESVLYGELFPKLSFKTRRVAGSTNIVAY